MILNRYLRAVSANYFFLGINTLFFLIITPVAIRVMGLELYGLWTIMNAILIFSAVGTLGMGVAINKFGAEVDKSALDPRAILTAGTVILIPMATLIAVFIIFMRGWIAQALSIAPTMQEQVARALFFTALSLFPQFLSSIYRGYLFSQLRYSQAQLVDTLVNIALWSGAVWIAWASSNIVLMAIWGFFIQIIALVLYLWLIARIGVLHWRWQTLALRRMLNFSMFTFVQSLASSLFQNFDRILVGLLLGPAEAGVYAVGTSLGSRLPMITGQITDVMVPYASRTASKREITKIRKTLGTLSGTVTLSLMLIGSLSILWMHMILSIWISPAYAKSYSVVFQILIFAYMLMSASRPAYQTLIGIGEVKTAALIYLSGSGIMLIGLFYGASFWGLIGAAAANLVLGLLLILNFIIYAFLGSLKPWRKVVTNLLVLVVIPSVSFAYSLAVPRTWSSNAGASLVVALLALLIFYRDVELRREISFILTGSQVPRE